MTDEYNDRHAFELEQIAADEHDAEVRAAARAELLEQLAVELDTPGVLWWGFKGPQVQIDPVEVGGHYVLVPLGDWLRNYELRASLA